MTDTGLPTLPEGYFWRVQHHREYADTAYGRLRVADDRERLQVVLIHRTELRYPRSSKRWWFFNKNVTNVDVNEREVLVENALGTNKIAIQNAANRIVKLWEKAKERDALIGDYPPLSL